MSKNGKSEGISLEIEKLRLEAPGIQSIFEKMPLTSVSNEALEEMRKEQMEYNKEIVEILHLMRLEIKGSQEKMREELEELKEKQEESEEKMMNKLQIIESQVKVNKETMDSLQSMDSKMESVQKEQKKVMDEVEKSKKETIDSIRLMVTEMKEKQKESEEKVMERLHIMTTLIVVMQVDMNIRLEKIEEEQKKMMEELKQETMKTVTDEQEKVLKEVETIWKAPRKDSEPEVQNKQGDQAKQIDESDLEESETTSELLSELEFKVYFWPEFQRFTVYSLPTRTILQLKEGIEKLYNIPMQQQNIFFQYEKCEDHQTIHECGIVNGSAVDLHLS